MNVLVTLGAGFQFVSPACDAVTETEPFPVKVRFASPVSNAGPDSTAKFIGRPDEAVAFKTSEFVAT